MLPWQEQDRWSPSQCLHSSLELILSSTCSPLYPTRSASYWVHSSKTPLYWVHHLFVFAFAFCGQSPSGHNSSIPIWRRRTPVVHHCGLLFTYSVANCGLLVNRCSLSFQMLRGMEDPKAYCLLAASILNDAVVIHLFGRMRKGCWVLYVIADMQRKLADFVTFNIDWLHDSFLRFQEFGLSKPQLGVFI